MSVLCRPSLWVLGKISCSWWGQETTVALDRIVYVQSLTQLNSIVCKFKMEDFVCYPFYLEQNLKAYYSLDKLLSTIPHQKSQGCFGNSDIIKHLALYCSMWTLNTYLFNE